MTEIAQIKGWTDEDKLSAQLREKESHSFILEIWNLVPKAFGMEFDLNTSICS